MAANCKPLLAQAAMAWSRVTALWRTVNCCPEAMVAMTAKRAADDAIIVGCCVVVRG